MVLKKLESPKRDQMPNIDVNEVCGRWTVSTVTPGAETESEQWLVKPGQTGSTSQEVQLELHNWLGSVWSPFCMAG